MTHEPVSDATRRDADSQESARANRSWWDAEAADYYAEHGRFLGDGQFVWGPEGLDEQDAGLLGDVRGRRVLEVGAGAGQCSRWLAAQGAQPVAVDLSIGMLRQGVQIDPATAVPMVQADACALPLADASMDVACSAYGAVPFVADSAALMREVARVLRPGGPVVISFSNRCFPTKAIRGWLMTDDAQHCAIVAEYLGLAGGFTKPEASLRTPSGRYHGDPLYAVVARRTDG